MHVFRCIVEFGILTSLTSASDMSSVPARVLDLGGRCKLLTIYREVRVPAVVGGLFLMPESYRASQ